MEEVADRMEKPLGRGGVKALKEMVRIRYGYCLENEE